MPYQRLEVEHRNGVSTIWMNRPDKRNALDRVMVEELHQAFQDTKADNAVRAVILAGRGTAFSAGADLAYLQQLSEFTVLDNMEDSAALARTLHTIYTLPKPVIARVHGPAIAGGCGLATVCDIVVALDTARFGYTEVNIGFIPAIVMAFLVRKVPRMHAHELVMTGRVVDANEAYRRGLVTTVITSEDSVNPERALDEHITRVAAEIVKASPTAVKLTKEMLVALDEMPLEAALDYAARMNAITRMTPDCREGIRAFLEKNAEKKGD